MLDSNNRYTYFDYNPSNLIGSGYYGNVYRISETVCLKVFKEELMLCLKTEVLDTISNNNYPNLCNIYSVYHDFQKFLVGYTMEYLDKIDLSILENKDYLLDSLNNLYESMVRLGEQKIEVFDLEPYNVITTKNGIYLLDFDLYTFSKKEKDEIINFNVKYLLRLYAKLIKNDLIKRMLFIGENVSESKLNLLFDSSNTVQDIITILNGYDKPVTYFKK